MKKLNKLDKYIIFCFIVLILYTIAEFVTYFEHPQLTICFFSVFGGEILCACLIKRLKLKGYTKGDWKNEYN